MIDVPVETDGRRHDLGGLLSQQAAVPLKVWYHHHGHHQQSGKRVCRQPYVDLKRPSQLWDASAGDRRDSTADCF